jgi:hypothetical protein
MISSLSEVDISFTRVNNTSFVIKSVIGICRFLTAFGMTTLLWDTRGEEVAIRNYLNLIYKPVLRIATSSPPYPTNYHVIPSKARNLQ